MRIISGSMRGTKLYTLDGVDVTRPTLDRVKESLFNILNFELKDSVVLDLFAGSGALGLESISRGAQKAYFCDLSFNAIKIINQNIEKTRCKNKTEVLQKDYKKALDKFKEEQIKFDIVFLDPPYKTDYTKDAVDKILEYDLLNENGKIIIETDIEKEVLSELQDFLVDIYDVRKYGRVSLIFIRRKG
jgi:16S rRNA (guanine(966)-N(2))-methyltransferase RsmD